jgi:hypothetical protein
MCVCVCVCVCVQKHVYIHTYPHTYTYTHTHVKTHTHINTHTHTHIHPSYREAEDEVLGSVRSEISLASLAVDLAHRHLVNNRLCVCVCACICVCVCVRAWGVFRVFFLNRQPRVCARVCVCVHACCLERSCEHSCSVCWCSSVGVFVRVCNSIQLMFEEGLSLVFVCNSNVIKECRTTELDFESRAKKNETLLFVPFSLRRKLSNSESLIIGRPSA